MYIQNLFLNKSRYNLGKSSFINGTGFVIKKELIDKNGEAVLICPEVLGGLSIPRDPAEIVSEEPLCVETVNGKNVTKEYVEGAQRALDILKAYDIDYVILKSRSPSCGLNHIYDGSFSHRVIDADGIFVRLLKKEGYKIYTEENYPGKQ